MLLVPVLIYPLLSSGLIVSLSVLICISGMVCVCLSKRNMRISLLMFWWILTLVPVLINSSALRMHQYGFSILWIATLLFVIIGVQIVDVSYLKIVKCIGILSSIYVFSTIFVNLNIGTFFWNNIANIFRSGITTGTIKTAGLTSHYSHNGMYIALAGVVWYAYAINEKNKKYIFLFICSLIAMLFTQKRGPLLALIIAAIITILIREQGSFSKKFQRFLTGGLAILILTYVASLIFPSLFLVLERFSSNENLLTSREYLWQYAFEVFKEHPFLGAGWGSYSNNIDIVINTVSVNSIYAHNIYLQLLAETGIIGTSIFIIALIKSLTSIIKINRVELCADSISSTYSLCMQLFFLIYGLSGNPLYDKQMVLPYMIAIAISVYQANIVRN